MPSAVKVSDAGATAASTRKQLPMEITMAERVEITAVPVATSASDERGALHVVASFDSWNQVDRGRRSCGRAWISLRARARDCRRGLRAAAGGVHQPDADPPDRLLHHGGGQENSGTQGRAGGDRPQAQWSRVCG